MTTKEVKPVKKRSPPPSPFKKPLKEEKVYPAEEQGIEREETDEEVEEGMKTGRKDEDIYAKKGRELLEEDDEIEPWEEGFMEGASGLGQLGKDALTGEPLAGADDIIELEFEGKMYRFVSRANAEKFMKKKKGKK
ncbi:MAG: hypothetical protein AABX37_00620 [Nanoarchaeota archaeon]